jgi:leucyl-tRNA synthetase
VGQDIETFSFNTAIARMMELTNALYRYIDGPFSKFFAKEAVTQLILLMAPFAPHFTEEIWERLGRKYSIFNKAFPVYDQNLLIKEEITYPLQINGKVKDRFNMPADASKEDIEAYVKNRYKSYFAGMQTVKFIVVPGKIVNVVVKPQ